MCFRDEADFEQYLDLLKTASVKHSCVVHAYVLMSNHVHLLLTPNQADGASLVFRDLGRDYVRRFNKRHRRTGTLWEGRFKSSLIDAESYLLACYRYIELNPVRAGMVDVAADYPWSSFRANAYGESNELVVPHPVWLTLGSNDSMRRNSYLSLFDGLQSREQVEAIRFGLNKGLPTGGDRFIRAVERIAAVKLGNGKVGRPGKAR